MGRLLVFIIIIGAALAGAWFYMPGGKDMLLGAKDKAMSYLPGKADDSATDAAVVEPAAEEPAAAEPVADEPAAEEAPQD